MAEWQVARLIPTWGINSALEAEMRASSALLAVLSIVRDFSSALLTPLGAASAQRAQVETFIEVAFKLADGTVVRPDGLIRVSYGKRTFTALVEVKTGDNRLDADQVNAYWEAARQFNFDAVITISNEIPVLGQHPTEGLKVRANSKVRVHHFSWTRILSMAVMCKVHQGVKDPEQAWILGELIRYLESDASGAMSFSDMGPNWVSVRDGARSSTLQRQALEVKDVAHRWDQLMRYAALRLGSQIGADVQQVFPRSQRDPKARAAYLMESLCSDGVLDGVLKVPNAVGPITLRADLRARQVLAAVDVPAPTDRGSKARTSWLMRQLGEGIPTQLVIEAWARNARAPAIASLADARADREILEDPEARETLRYRLVLRSEAGVARKAGGKSPGFVDSVIDLLDRFYGTVVQGITPWVPKAPQLRPRPEAPASPEPEPADDRPAAEAALEQAAETADATSGPLHEELFTAPDLLPSELHPEDDRQATDEEPAPEPTPAFAPGPPGGDHQDADGDESEHR
jgi:hypothetical protein